MFWLILKPKLSFEVRYSIQLILQEMQRHVAHAEANSQTLTKCSASTPEPETQIGEKWKWKEKWETSCSCNWHWPNVLAQRSLSHKFLWLFEVIYSIQFNLFCWKSAEKSCLHAEASWHWPNVLPRRSLRQKFLLTVFENTLSQANLFLALKEIVFGINYISGRHGHCAKRLWVFISQSCEMSQIWQIYLCKNIARLG